MPDSSSDNLAISSKQNTTEKFVIVVFFLMPLSTPQKSQSPYVRVHVFV